MKTSGRWQLLAVVLLVAGVNFLTSEHVWLTYVGAAFLSVSVSAMGESTRARINEARR